VKTRDADISTFRVNADRVRINNTATPWIHGSFGRGISQLAIALLPEGTAPKERSFTLRLHFCELDNVAVGERIFDVKVQGSTVLEGIDVAREAGGRYRALVKEFRTIPAAAKMVIELIPHANAVNASNAPILSAIELQEQP
jgi:hypothetical protein